MRIRVIVDAEKLFKEGLDGLAMDAAVFCEIMAKQNPAQLRVVFKEYKRLADRNIWDVIEKDNFALIDFVASPIKNPDIVMTNTKTGEQGGILVSLTKDIKRGLIALVKCAINRPLLFADSLNATMEVSNAS